MLNAVTLLGSSSGRNAGDAALISGIMDACDQACGRPLRYEIPTIKPGFVSSTYGERAVAVSMLPWHLSIKMLGLPTYRSVMRTDLSLVFDAILFDRGLYNPLFNYLSTLHVLLPRVKKAGGKLGFFNVGVGPIHTARGREMLRELAELMDFITVRERDSYEILRDIGVTNPRILETADAALIVPPAEERAVDAVIRDLGLGSASEILAVNVNSYTNSWLAPKKEVLSKEGFAEIYARGLLRAIEEIDVPLLFVATQYQDLPITRAVMKRVQAAGRKTPLLTNTRHDHYAIKGVLGRVSLLFGMRLHSMILASSGGTPIIALAGQPKVDHYYRTLGIQEFSIGFSDISAETLCDHIKRGWESRSAIQGRLLRRIPVLQEKATQAALLVRALDQGADLDATLAALRASASRLPEAQG